MTVPRCPVLSITVSLLAGALLATGCSDSSGPAAPDVPDEPTTPDVPTVSSPQDELPATSDFLAVESAVLQNLSPMLTGMSPAGLAKLNEAYALEFQLPPGRDVLLDHGRACYPENLQTRLSPSGTWVALTRATAASPFVDLGTYEGSHYYLSSNPCQWWFGDVSCRNFGAQLASVTSAAENAFLLGAVQNAMPGARYFIGLTDWNRANNDWVWTSGEPASWTNWAAGEPNNDHGEYFVQVLPNGQWNDVNGNMCVYVLERATALPSLGEDPVPCAAVGTNKVFLDGLAAPTVVPHVERRLYWAKVFQVTLGAGATYSEAHSYTHGTSETTGMSFGWSIGISASIGWGPVSTEIETEFHQDFNHEVTVSSEETFTKTYQATAPPDKIMLLALWQLRERYVITDGNSQEWSDPAFILDGALPYLDQGLTQEYVQTILFDQS